MFIKLNLNNTTKQRSNEIISMFNSLKSPIQDIYNIPYLKKTKLTLKEINKHAEIKQLTADSVTIQNGNKKYILSSSAPYEMRLIIRNLKWKVIEKDITINNSTISSLKGYKPEPEKINDSINEVFDVFDKPLFQLKKIFMNDKFINYINSFKIPAKLNPENSILSTDIKDLFKTINKEITSIQCPYSRSSIKNGYSLISIGKQGSKQLEFNSIDGNKYLINILLDDKKQTNLIIKVTDPTGKISHIIVEPNGQVAKSKRVNKICKVGEKLEYYSEKEVNSPFITKTLLVSKRMLTDYHKYLIDKINELKVYQHKYSTTEVGIIKPEKQKQLVSIQEKNSKLREIFKDLKKQTREIARKTLDVQLFPSVNSATLLKKVGAYNEIIHLSFPKIKGEQCIKILILNRNNKVEKTYFIRNSKLVKYDAKNTSKSKVGSSVFHHYSQEEIDKSSLYTYIDDIDEKLNKILSKANGRAWYRKNT